MTARAAAFPYPRTSRRTPSETLLKCHAFFFFKAGMFHCCFALIISHHPKLW